MYVNVTFAVRALKSGAGVRESEILMKRGSNVSFKRYLSQNYMCIYLSPGHDLDRHDPSKKASHHIRYQSHRSEIHQGQGPSRLIHCSHKFDPHQI
jgi:hypothetical protein